MILDFILPKDLDPTLKLVVNMLVLVHILVFFCYIFLLARSFGKKPQDRIRDFAEQHEDPDKKKFR
jgi:hypothetical protein